MSGIGSMLNFRIVVVITEEIQTVTQAITAGVEGNTGSDNFNKRKAFSLQSLHNGHGDPAEMEGGPTGDISGSSSLESSLSRVL